MDFVGESGFKTEYVVDENSGDLTVTFKDEAGTTTLGTITIESLRFRAMIEALDHVAKAAYPDQTVGLGGSRTSFDVQTNIATTVFT